MMDRFFVIFIGCLAVVNGFTFLDLHEWISYKMQYSKRYATLAEDARRMNIYLKHKNEIDQHNQLFRSGRSSYELGVNKYTDLSHDEFVAQMNGLKRPAIPNTNVTYFKGSNGSIPRSIDWRDYGAVTGVKDQAGCASCWAFSSTGALEGQHFRKTGELIPLSEQNLIDCSGSYGTHGCNGGWMDQAFQYINGNGGIDTDKSYPYEGIDDTCKYTVENSGAATNGFVNIPEGDEDKLQEAVATIGPIATAIDSSLKSFQHYKSGIYDETNCGKDRSDHGALIVGYSSDAKGNEYYIVKNSWGTSWGEHGYVNMPRNRNNLCAIASAASFPIV